MSNRRKNLFMNDALEGFCIFPSLKGIELFTVKDYDPQDWSPYQIINCRISKLLRRKCRIIVFDFITTDEWPCGSVLGFFYADGLLLGTANYGRKTRVDLDALRNKISGSEKSDHGSLKKNSLQNKSLRPEFLRGYFTISGDKIEIKGSWHDYDNTEYGFYIQIGKKLW